MINEFSIREAQLADARSLSELFIQLYQQTDFMLLEPEEKPQTTEKQRKKIQSFVDKDRDAMFVAIVKNECVGIVVGRGGAARRNRNSTVIAMGVNEDFSGQGIGLSLLTEFERWARSQTFRRIELTVMSHNHRAIRLYEKSGFEKEGCKRDSLLVNGQYVDEWMMSKLI